MKRCWYTFALISFFLQCCNQSELYERKAKTLDSLNGALNLKIGEIRTTDTILLQRCITRFNYYRIFIKQNINDTLSKAEADNLQRFYVGGKNLSCFYGNRFTLLERAAIINSQQSRLVKDIRSHTLEPHEMEQFLAAEMEAVTQLLEAAGIQQKVFFSNIVEFKNSLREVENLIRAHNKGQLPTIIKDTVSL